MIRECVYQENHQGRVLCTLRGRLSPSCSDCSLADQPDKPPEPPKPPHPEWSDILDVLAAFMNAALAVQEYCRRSCPDAAHHACPVFDGDGHCGDPRCLAMLAGVRCAMRKLKGVVE
jgi:hypothetical protein